MSAVALDSDDAVLGIYCRARVAEAGPTFVGNRQTPPQSSDSLPLPVELSSGDSAGTVRLSRPSAAARDGEPAPKVEAYA